MPYSLRQQIIEFFGIPGSGKTFLKEKLLIEFDKGNYKVYSYKKILEKFLPSNEKNISNALEIQSRFSSEACMEKFLSSLDLR